MEKPEDQIGMTTQASKSPRLFPDSGEFVSTILPRTIIRL
jgi:hypothetical protein